MSKIAMDEAVKLEQRRIVMVDYLKLKTAEEDWHGVADAAMDLRDIDSELKVYRRFESDDVGNPIVRFYE